MALPRPANPGLLIVLFLFAFLGIATVFINPIQTTYGIKGDEATYVTMALSIAYDGDLSFERHDLTRFWSLYQSGPQGIFLKQGNGDTNRLFFGKSFIYPLLAAPFVRLAGLNGLLLLNVLLLAALFVCLYLYAATRMSPLAALLITTGFLSASITPLFAVWMMPEIFNLALVGIGYFFWLYKETCPQREETAASKLLLGSRSDIVAALFLGLATFSKPSNVVLILPLLALPLWQKNITRSLRIGVVFGLVVAAGFGTNALISGEFNYQGGDRKTFYDRFPFQDAESTFDDTGISVTTDELAFEGWQHLGRNMGYFLFGRHFGLLPYYFPALVIAVWVVRRWRERTVFQGLISTAVIITVTALLLLLPNTWSGGGGPPGNRYFLSIYPAVFFLIPVARSVLPGVIMWVGGALFVAQILVDPFVAAKRPWQNAQSGLFRMLPIELTMVNDLPVRLNQQRSRIPYGESPSLLLNYLDQNAWRPEKSGIWVAGRARTDIVIRTDPPVSALDVTLRSPVTNTVTVTVDGSTQRVELQPREPVTLRTSVEGVHASGAQNFVLTVETTEGVVPHLENSRSNDRRFLGVLVNLDAIRGEN